MLRKLSMAITASAACLLLSGGIAVAAEPGPQYLDTESGTPFVDANLPSMQISEPSTSDQAATPVGATGTEGPVSESAIPDQSRESNSE